MILLILLFVLLGLMGYLVYIYLDNRRRTNPTEVDRAKYSKGIDLVKRQQHQQAFTYFTQVLTRDPASAVALAYRGKCHLAMGNWYEAIADCNRAASFTHDIAGVYLDKGIALYKLALYHESFLEIDKAAWYFRQTDGCACRWRGVIRLKLGLPDEAAKDFQKAIALGDEHASYFMYTLQQGGNIDAIERMI